MRMQSRTPEWRDIRPFDPFSKVLAFIASNTRAALPHLISAPVGGKPPSGLIPTVR